MTCGSVIQHNYGLLSRKLQKILAQLPLFKQYSIGHNWI